jgi:polyisoprenoid-binding protein YceI
MKKIIFTVATLFFLGIVFAFTVISNWKIVNDYSIKFSGKDVNGIFKKFTGNIEFDEANLAASKFYLVIEVASINTGNGLQNKHAKSGDWFDAANYPQIKFTSSKIEKSGNTWSVKGKMEVHGVAKEMNIPFSFSKTGNQGIFTAGFIVKRSDFNIGKPGGDTANDIKVEVKVPVSK